MCKEISKESRNGFKSATLKDRETASSVEKSSLYLPPDSDKWEIFKRVCLFLI